MEGKSLPSRAAVEEECLGEDVDRYIQRARDLHYYGGTYLAAHRSGYSSASSAPWAKKASCVVDSLAISTPAPPFANLDKRVSERVGVVVGVVSQYFQAVPFTVLMT
jgi:hypothetical protein